MSLAFPQPLTWTRVHRNIWNLGASATPAARLLPLFNLGEDLGLGDGIVWGKTEGLAFAMFRSELGAGSLGNQDGLETTFLDW